MVFAPVGQGVVVPQFGRLVEDEVTSARRRRHSGDPVPDVLEDLQRLRRCSGTFHHHATAEGCWRGIRFVRSQREVVVEGPRSGVPPLDLLLLLGRQRLVATAQAPVRFWQAQGRGQEGRWLAPRLDRRRPALLRRRARQSGDTNARSARVATPRVGFQESANRWQWRVAQRSPRDVSDGSTPRRASARTCPTRTFGL